MKELTENYAELPLPIFLHLFPDFRPMINGLIDPTDSNYIVRFDGNRFEFGYVSDTWNAFDAS